jgi:hypothetical protein
MLRHVLIGVSGFSGTGKDAITNRLKSKHGAIQIGMTDPAKRHMAEIYGFTEEQLFGPSNKRNSGDLRYPKKIFNELMICPVELTKHTIDVEIMSDFIHMTPITLDKTKRYFVYESLSKVAIPSIMRGVPCSLDEKHRPKVFYIEAGNPSFWLSPREALQRYCELMNLMYENTWIRKNIENHRLLTQVKHVYNIPDENMFQKHMFKVRNEISLKYNYHRMRGLVENQDDSYRRLVDGVFITCSSDYRHWHEIKLTRELADIYTPVFVRIKRPGITEPPYQHRSETEQVSIPDSEFDFIIDNDGSIDDLNAKVDEMIGKIIPTIKSKHINPIESDPEMETVKANEEKHETIKV